MKMKIGQRRHFVDDEIKICSDHRDYEVPLISTFAFRGAEFWCPYCGTAEGMFGAGENVKTTRQLEVRSEMWEQHTEEFLTARSQLVCSSLIWKGKEIKPSELPQEEIDRCKQVVKDYVYEVKL